MKNLVKETGIKPAKSVRSSKKFPRRQGLRKILIFISFILFPVTIYYFSPYLPIQGGAEGIVVGSLIMFAGMFVSSLFLGRAFCGWVCPAGGLSETLGHLKKNNKRINLKTSIIKWFIFVPWVSLVIAMPFIMGTRWQKIKFFYQTDEKFGISFSVFDSNGDFDIAFMIYYIIVFLVVVLLLLVGKRSFCHHECWMAPFMIIGRWIGNLTRIPALRLKPDSNACISCKRCTRECPMSLPVENMVLESKMEHRECILCGTCIDVCRKNAITYSFSSFKK